MESVQEKQAWQWNAQTGKMNPNYRSENILEQQARPTSGARMGSKAIGQTFGTPYSEFLLRGIIFLIGRYSGAWLAGEAGWWPDWCKRTWAHYWEIISRGVESRRSENIFLSFKPDTGVHIFPGETDRQIGDDTTDGQTTFSCSKLSDTSKPRWQTKARRDEWDGSATHYRWASYSGDKA